MTNASSTPPFTGVSPQELRQAIDVHYDDVVRIRRRIHAHPELSGHEQQTARLVFHTLQHFGLKPRYFVDKTGVAATVSNAGGPTVVLRADIDALPVQERNELSYRSTVPGVMHACGHDMHTAALLGAAAVIHSLRRKLKGSVVFLFQPSEEVEPGGAVKMIAEGAFPRDADAVYGLHVSTDHRTGQVGIRAGEDCSGVLTFDVTVKGKGGHGAMPEKTVDPIVCASSMVMELQRLISRECPPFEPAVLTVGTFHSGTKRNIIPDEATFQGTIRTFSNDIQAMIRRRVREVCRALATSFRARVELSFQESYPPGYNDPGAADRAKERLVRYLGPRRVVDRAQPSMFAEDFAYYLKKCPGSYLHLGVRKGRNANVPGIHSAGFVPDEEALRTAILVHSVMAPGIGDP